jgi:O-glycosyl hydrolase
MPLPIDVNLRQTYQEMDGFGICQGLGRARILRGSQGLPPLRTREVLDLLFGFEGAAFSILRVCIGSSPSDGPGTMKSIAPDDPGGPDRPLRFSWDGDDCGQVWLAQEAVNYGVSRIFASPLSAPAYMIQHCTSEGNDAPKGVTDASPCAGDWRPAFIEYLLQYVRFYAESGVEITDLAFANQPDIYMHYPSHASKYPLMRLETHQIVDFVKMLGSALKQAGLPARLVCGNAISWDQQVLYTEAVEADAAAASHVDVYGGNSYSTPARRPLPTKRPSWMTEWSPDAEVYDGEWNDAWDSGRRCDGILLAEDVMDALNLAHVSGYLYLFGASARPGTKALIWLDGTKYQISKRFWALAAYSRMIRPGSRRVGVRPLPAEHGLKVAAFCRPDDAIVVVLLNLRAEEISVKVDITPHPKALTVQQWLTDANHSLALIDSRWAAGEVILPARSLTTLLLIK